MRDTRLPTGRTVIAANGVHAVLTITAIGADWILDGELILAYILIATVALSAGICVALAVGADRRSVLAVAESYGLGLRQNGLLDLGIRRADLQATLRKARQAPKLPNRLGDSGTEVPRHGEDKPAPARRGKHLPARRWPLDH
ncbi:hypothetical protein [Sphaerisporangium sp. NPDC051011]|uniref:hypothetical protein n=1 Tax=Sphaerisporangium sp. NPDC051011 TaxID=3155792 RepID=UPI0033C3E9D9